MKLALITSPLAPLYSSPASSEVRIDEVLYGMIVEILDHNDDNWCYINTPYNYKGYIEDKYLSIVDYELFAIENYNLLQVESLFCDVLENPEIESKLLLTLPRGAYLYSAEQTCNKGMWTKVYLSPNNLGWVKSGHVKKENKCNITEEKLRENIVESALSYLGVQYRWGGKTPLGIDCSGLCSMAYMLNGINIYRDAKLQSGFPIKPISKEELKKADLIYYPGHIAMYLGDNKIIHATNSNGIVKINSINKNDQDYDNVHGSNIIAYGSYFD